MPNPPEESLIHRDLREIETGKLFHVRSRFLNCSRDDWPGQTFTVWNATCREPYEVRGIPAYEIGEGKRYEMLPAKPESAHVHPPPRTGPDTWTQLAIAELKRKGLPLPEGVEDPSEE